MPRLLILLTLPPDVTEQYRQRLSKKFPELTIDVCSDKTKAEDAIKAAIADYRKKKGQAVAPASTPGEAHARQAFDGNGNG